MGEQYPVRLVVMGHTMQVKDKKMILHTYDLKGSMVNRFVKGTVKPTAPAKDKNLLEDVRFSEDLFLNFSQKDQRFFNGHTHSNVKETCVQGQIEKDINLLKDFNLMDYSLLICIERVKEGEKYIKPKEPHFARHIFVGESGKFVYHVSIIDYLQDYHIEKKFENAFKSLKDRKNRKLISAVHPDDYAKRF